MCNGDEERGVYLDHCAEKPERFLVVPLRYGFGYYGLIKQSLQEGHMVWFTNAMSIKKAKINKKKEVEKEEKQKKILERLGFVQMVFDFYAAPVG